METQSITAMAILLIWFSLANARQDLPSIPADAFRSSSMCHAIPYLMTINKEGCLKRKIQTNICAGSCLSVFIPRHRMAPMETCSTCQPKTQQNVTLSLLCKKKGVYYKEKELITIVSSCGCETKPHLCWKA